MKRKPERERRAAPARLTAMAIAVAGCAAASGSVLAASDSFSEKTFTIDGYLRGEFSWNTKNWQDTPNYNDRGKMSMARATVRVNADWRATDSLALVAKVRASQEYQTSFLKHLEKNGAYNYHSGARGDLMDLYNDAEIRELYLDWKASDRVKFRFGKQQVVWL